MQRIHIFKAGKHTSAGGTTLDFSEDVLRAAAAAYDPAVHEAPIVVGHPKDNAPAYGWVSGLDYAEGNLEALPAQVDEAFAEAVKAGRYKKVSASFYTPESPANPKPGTYYLRHVGFLGAQPPAIKGLKAVNFAEAEEGVVEFGEWETASFMRRMREWIIGKFGLEEADQAIPSHLVEGAENSARMPVLTANDAPIYNEPETVTMTPEQIAELEARAATAEAALATLQAQQADFAERERKLARAETERRVDALVQAGKVLPAERDGLVEYLEAVPAETIVEFGEGDSATKAPARDYLLDMLGKRAALVEFGEHGAPDGNPKPGALSAEQLAAKAVEFQESESKAGRTVSTSDAVQAVLTGAAA